MSRRLTLVVVTLASLAVTACSTAPTSPDRGIRTPDGVNADSVITGTDSTGRSIWSSSNG